MTSTINSDVWVARIIPCTIPITLKPCTIILLRLIHNYFHFFPFCQSILSASTSLLPLHTQEFLWWRDTDLLSIGFLIYDHIITLGMTCRGLCWLWYSWCVFLGDEIEYLWKRPKTRGMMWFFATRYIGLFGNISVTIFGFTELSTMVRGTTLESSKIGYRKFIAEVWFPLSEGLSWHLDLMKLQDI